MKTLDGFSMCVLDCFRASIAQHNFQPGDTLYDTPEAYGVWQTALEQMKLCVQVESAARGPAGNITLKVLRPNHHRTALVCVATVGTTQEAFISLLRSGDIESFFQHHSQTTAYV